VSEGEHIIEMRFSPPNFRFGVVISITIAIVMASISLWVLVRHGYRFRL
jgi:hypothetical protein